MSSYPLKRILRQEKQSRGQITYLADFVYEKGSQTIVEDVKDYERMSTR